MAIAFEAAATARSIVEATKAWIVRWVFWLTECTAGILAVVILLWTAAMAISGTATSYIYLLVTRVFLGAVTAAAWPAVASLVGDFFPARERAGIYGLILSGELIGTGIAFLFLARCRAWPLGIGRFMRWPCRASRSRG